jgi:hypothetical protein
MSKKVTEAVGIVLRYIVITIMVILSIIAIYYMLNNHKKLCNIGTYYDLGIIVEKKTYSSNSTLTTILDNTKSTRELKNDILYVWDKETNDVFKVEDDVLFNSLDKDDQVIIRREVTEDIITRSIVKEYYSIE